METQQQVMALSGDDVGSPTAPVQETVQTQQQKMAIAAFKRVSGVSPGDKQKYGTMAHKLPMLIRSAGLAQALAFVEARGEPAQKKLLDHLAETIEIADITKRQQLVEKSRKAELRQYMLLTRRTLAALVWYTRYAESILGVSKRDNAGSPAAEEQGPAKSGGQDDAGSSSPAEQEAAVSGGQNEG